MEVRFFEPGTIPEHTTPGWYSERARAPHLEQDGHSGRLHLAAEFVEQAIRDYDVRSVSDMGCGDGGLLSLLKTIPVAAWGYDLQPANVKAARSDRLVNATLANCLTGDVAWGDLAVCTEVLEHLVDPHAFVRSIPSRVLVASSPDGETQDSRYEFHTWGWDMAGYRALIEQGGFEVARHETIGFQVILGVKQ